LLRNEWTQALRDIITGLVLAATLGLIKTEFDRSRWEGTMEERIEYAINMSHEAVRKIDEMLREERMERRRRNADP
jgi:hypothetical protein